MDMLSLLGKNPALQDAMQHAKALADTALSNQREIVLINTKLEAMMRHMMTQTALIERILKNQEGDKDDA